MADTYTAVVRRRHGAFAGDVLGVAGANATATTLADLLDYLHEKVLSAGFPRGEIRLVDSHGDTMTEFEPGGSTFHRRL